MKALFAWLAAVAACLWQRMRVAWGFLLTKLNAFGGLALFYIVEDETALAHFFLLFPEPVRPAAKLLLPLAWWWLVQHATKRALVDGK